MLNITGMLKAPRLIKWEVMIERKRSLNEAQNARKQRRNVEAHDEASAKEQALRGFPEFVVLSVRKKP